MWTKPLANDIGYNDIAFGIGLDGCTDLEAAVLFNAELVDNCFCNAGGETRR
jgi:hypothetical protein